MVCLHVDCNAASIICRLCPVQSRSSDFDHSVEYCAFGFSWRSQLQAPTDGRFCWSQATKPTASLASIESPFASSQYPTSVSKATQRDRQTNVAIDCNVHTCANFRYWFDQRCSFDKTLSSPLDTGSHLASSNTTQHHP